MDNPARLQMMEPQSEPDLLDDLAARFGITADYYDIFGRRHVTSPDTKRAILAAMGVKTDTVENVAGELAAARDDVWRTPCDPVLVRRAECPGGTWSLRMPVESDKEGAVRIEWTVSDEQGNCRLKEAVGPGLSPSETAVIDGRRYARFDLPLPADLEMGYYEVAAVSSGGGRRVKAAFRLILTPDRCFLPKPLEDGGRLWGLSVQLYALRSQRNWGVGDFGDLAECLQWAATDLRAGLLGLNPLHALNNTRPYHISPYSPDSRLYLNILYVDLEQIPEWSECAEAQTLRQDEPFRSQLDAWRDQETVNYEQVYAAKLKVLAMLFATFRDRHCRFQGNGLRPRTERGRAFERFVREEGESLERFALFHTLSETLEGEAGKQILWHDWPEPYRHPRSPALRAYRSAHWARIRFYQYLQWVAAEQLQAAARRAEELGMPLGLYHDLALGSDRTGSDAWAFQDVLALDADCGAPPDDFARDGQNWGLPPVIPHRLRRNGYRMFSELVRKNLTYGGALRIDHVMALFRLFWVPKGMPASAGAYVAYPWEDLLGILALESVRHRAVIVGEDLGTVPDEVRERLAAYRVLSYRVFYFERTQSGEWKRPAEYPRDALAVISTHDLPTLAGYWTEEDIELRFKLGMYADEAAYRGALDARRLDKARILDTLRSEGLLNDEPNRISPDARHWPAELGQAVHAYVARTPSCLMLASLEDMLDHHVQINLPGTLDSYPNWSLKIPPALDALRDDPRPRSLAAILGAIRPRP